MTDKPLRGALVGFGKMAENGHLPGWLKDGRVSLEAVCDPDPNRRDLAGKQLGFRTYESLEELLEKEALDFVDICTPPPFHANSIATSLRSGLHVLCEKPFVGTRKDFRRILELGEKTGRIAFPVHNWKHAPILAKLQQWIRNGRLGEILYSEFHTLRTQPAVGMTPWRGEREGAGGGGILLDHGWHVTYLLMNFHREAPRAVSAWARQAPPASGGAETSVHVVLEFPNSTGAMFLTWEAPRRCNSARVYGEKGFVTLEDKRLTLYDREGSKQASAYRSPLSEGSHHPGWFPPVIDRFLDAIKNPEAAIKEFEEARTCLDVMLKGYESMRKGGSAIPLSAGDDGLTE